MQVVQGRAGWVSVGKVEITKLIDDIGNQYPTKDRFPDTISKTAKGDN